MSIKYVVHINNTTGHINRISYPRHNIPSEGVSGNERIVYVTEDTVPSAACAASPRHFIENYVWDVSSSSFYNTGEKPNKHAYWDTSLTPAGWNWSSSALLNDIRDIRRGKLNQSDWAILPDSPLSASSKSAAQTYRTALRDLPANLSMSSISSVDDVVWPTKPTFL